MLAPGHKLRCFSQCTLEITKQNQQEATLVEEHRDYLPLLDPNRTKLGRPTADTLISLGLTFLFCYTEFPSLVPQ